MSLLRSSVEAFAAQPIPAKAAAQVDVVGVFARNQHVRFGDGVGLLVQLLAIHHNFHVGIDVAQDVFLGDGQHPARAAGGAKDGADDALALQFGGVFGKEQVDHQPDHLAGGVVLPGGLVRHFRKAAQQLLKDVAHRD